MGSSSAKGSFHPPKVIGRSLRRKMGRSFNPLKELCITNAMAMGISRRSVPTTLSDFDSSNSDIKGECDIEGNYRAFMAIASVDSKDDLSNLVDELGDLSEGKEVEDLEDEDMYQIEGENNLQEAYDSLLEDCGKYAKVANLVVKKMKKVEEKHRCILVQHKEAKCEVERLKGELVEAFSKVKFIELENFQANVKVECISTKKLDTMLSSQKSSHDKTGLGYTREGSSSSELKKEVRLI